MRAEMEACRTDPSRFNEVILSRGPYWSRQRQICRSVVDFPVTAAPAGNCVGKSHVGSGIGLWFSVMHPFSRVVIAAPTNAQLSQVLWAALQGAYKSAESGGVHLGGKFDGLSLEFGDGWSIEGWGQGSIESKSGRHAGDLLAIIDEASGCKPAVMEAIDSLNPSRRLFLGNPLHPFGKFYDICQQADKPHVNVITIPSLESPHIHLERSPWGLADASWLAQNAEEYGTDSIWWRAHVLAQFPDEITQALLPIAWLNEAAACKPARSGPVRLGVDIGLGKGNGDPSCIVARDDVAVLDAWESNRWDLEELARQVATRAKQYGVRPQHITFDATGVGADVDNRLRAAGLDGAKGYMGANSGGERFCNLRSASGWALRRRLDAHRTVRKPDPAAPAGRPAPHVPQPPFHLPQSLLGRYRPELQGVRYQLDDHGRVQLEPKEQLIARLKKSPNFLDALAMTFAFPHS
jgi:hypothetical protein